MHCQPLHALQAVAMSKFDPAAHFEKEFDRLRAEVGRSQVTPLRPRLLALLEQYRPKLPPALHAERTVEAGRMLLRIGEHEAALRNCFGPILSSSGDDLGNEGVHALKLRVCAELGSVEGSYDLLMARDTRLRSSDSAQTMGLLLGRARDAIGSCLRTESLYWVVLNGTRLIYRMCTCLMRPERAALAIEPLAWSALCMEGMLPLLTLDFLPWRLQIYTALCHCYEAAGMVSGAAKAVAHVRDHLAKLRKLDRHDPVPPSEEMAAIYLAAESKLAALAAKYTWLQPPAEEAQPEATGKDKGKEKPKGKAAPPPEPDPASGDRIRGVQLSEFGDSIALKLSGLLECAADYSSTAHALQHVPPAEERAALVREIADAALSLVQPAVDAIDESTSAAAAAAAATEAAHAAATASTAAPAAEEVEAAAAAPAGDAPAEEEATPAGMQAAAEAAAEMAATAAAVAANACAELPAASHVELVKLCHTNELWDQLDALLPSAVARTEEAVRPLLGRSAEAVPADASPAAAAPLPTTKPTDQLALLTGAPQTRATAFPTLQAQPSLAASMYSAGTSASPEPPPPPALSSEERAAAVAYVEVQLLAIGREVEEAETAGDAAAHLVGLRKLAVLLDRCLQPPLAPAVIPALTDGLVDGALRLWRFCAPMTQSGAELSQRQPATSFERRGGAAAAGSELFVTLTPKTRADGAKLLTAVEQIALEASGLSFTR